MNLASIVLLTVIVAAIAYGIVKIKRSKGACDDCDVSTCPVHELSADSGCDCGTDKSSVS